jgi:hypothetical protein
MRPAVFMNKSFAIILFVAFFGSSTLFGDENGKPTISAFGGMSYACLVPKRPVDGVSGASKIGVHGGVHVEFDVVGHYIETGLDYSLLKSDVRYADVPNGIDGTRALLVHAIDLPLMYSWHLLEGASGDPRLTFGVGAMASFFLKHDAGETGTLARYDPKAWSAGPCLRLGFYPLPLKGTLNTGLYLSLFRSLGPLFSDEYFSGKKAAVPGTLDFGICIRIKP